MVPGGEAKDFSERNRMIAESVEYDKRIVRTFIASILVVASGIIMVSGIKIIGQSEEVGWASSTSLYTYWHTAQLEWGIFFALAGTLAVMLSVMHLLSVWQKKKV